MAKKLLIKLGILVLAGLLLLTGCDSNREITQRVQVVDPPAVPGRLLLSSGQNAGLAAVYSDNPDDPLVGNFKNCYYNTTLCDTIIKAFANKINEIITMEDTVLDYTLVNGIAVEGTSAVNEARTVDIIYSTAVEARYSLYDVKYTVIDQDDGSKSYIYRTIDGSKVYYVDSAVVQGQPVAAEYVYERLNGETNGYLLVHQHIGADYRKSLIKITETDTQSRVRLIMLQDGTTRPYIINFAGIEDKLSENVSGAMFITSYYQEAGPEDSWLTADTAEVLNEMNSPVNSAPNFLGIFTSSGVITERGIAGCSLADPADFDSIYIEGYPTEEEVLDFYSNSAITYRHLYLASKENDLSSPEGLSLIEILLSL